MDLREVIDDIKEKADEQRDKGPEKALKDFHRKYGIDQRELGKIMVIASVTLLVVSIPSALTLEKTHKQIKDVNEKFDRMEVIMNDDNFESALSSLSQVQGSNVGENAKQVNKRFDEASENLEGMDETQEKLKRHSNDYKWLSLIGVVGVVTGMATMYI